MNITKICHSLQHVTVVSKHLVLGNSWERERKWILFYLGDGHHTDLRILAVLLVTFLISLLIHQIGVDADQSKMISR